MTADELRADADRREALARAATPGPWIACRGSDSTPYCLGVADGGCVAVDTSFKLDTAVALATMQHCAANDPPAVLASVERDRLLADMLDWMRTASLACPTEAAYAARNDLLRRFAALEGK